MCVDARSGEFFNRSAQLLTDDSPTGKVQAGDEVEGSIPRGDVAALIATLLATGAGVGAQFEVVSGETPIAEAVAAL